MKKLLLIVILSSTLLAQEGKPGYKTVPVFDEDDKLMLSGLIAMGTQANKLCSDLPESKAFLDYQKKLIARMENKYKGFTLNGVNLEEIKK